MNSLKHSSSLFSYLIVPVCMLLFSCCERDEGCPDERNTGDGTISFYVDGKLWQNSCDVKHGSSGINIGGSSYSYFFGGSVSDSGFYVEGRIWEESTIHISGTIGNGIESYEIGDGISDYSGASDDFIDCKITFYYKDKEYLSKSGFGFIERTMSIWDTSIAGDNKWDSHGVFEATLFNAEDSTDIVYIKDGFWNN